jgi:hypothetical protein
MTEVSLSMSRMSVVALMNAVFLDQISECIPEKLYSLQEDHILRDTDLFQPWNMCIS